MSIKPKREYNILAPCHQAFSEEDVKKIHIREKKRAIPLMIVDHEQNTHLMVRGDGTITIQGASFFSPMIAEALIKLMCLDVDQTRYMEAIYGALIEIGPLKYPDRKTAKEVKGACDETLRNRR